MAAMFSRGLDCGGLEMAAAVMASNMPEHKMVFCLECIVDGLAAKR